jgi:hypothetical protein
MEQGVGNFMFVYVPDVPVVSLGLILSQSKWLALETNGVLCMQQPVVPTAFTTQKSSSSTGLH